MNVGNTCVLLNDSRLSQLAWAGLFSRGFDINICDLSAICDFHQYLPRFNRIIFVSEEEEKRRKKKINLQNENGQYKRLLVRGVNGHMQRANGATQCYR